MEKLIRSSLFFLVFIIGQDNADCQGWQRLHPLTTRSELTAVLFSDSLTGYTSGSSGMVLKTSDGGICWRQLGTGESITLRSICFTDSLTGYAAGDSGRILKTVDGGKTWSRQVTNTLRTLSGIVFPGNTRGFAAGANGTILRTDNGGGNWLPCVAPSGENMYSIFFTSENTGYVIGDTSFYRPPSVYKTTDGGNTWSKLLIHPEKKYILRKIFFPSTDTGYISGDNGVIVKTCDGGLTWTSPPNNLGPSIYTIFFINNDTGWMAKQNTSYSDFLFRTTDGGITWDPVSDFHFGGAVSGMYFTSARNGHVISSETHISRTTDGGATWKFSTPGGNSDFRAVVFLDSLTGFVASGQNTIQKTVNGGNDWETVNTAPGYFSEPVVRMRFPGPENGYALSRDGAGAVFLTTADTGRNWVYHYLEPYPTPLGAVKSFSILSSGTGYVVGDGSTKFGNFSMIFKTLDGGVTWQLPTSPSKKEFNDIWFMDDHTGFLAGVTGSILKSDDGGNTWTDIPSGTSKTLIRMDFPDRDTGYIVGAEGTILKTTNGGAAWMTLNSGTNVLLSSVHFIDPRNGYAAGYQGTILHTTDGGLTWEVQETGTGAKLFDIWFPDRNHGYAVGLENWETWPYTGIILKTTNGGYASVPPSEAREKETISIYPNPARETIFISFPATEKEIPVIELLNFQGVFVKSFSIDQNINRQGPVEIAIPDVKPGFYFLRIRTGNRPFTGKVMIL